MLKMRLAYGVIDLKMLGEISALKTRSMIRLRDKILLSGYECVFFN